MFNKDERKSLARKNGNENPIWSWNNSPVGSNEGQRSGGSGVIYYSEAEYGRSV